MPERSRRDVFATVLIVVGGLSIANAAWMLVEPRGWYTDLPAAVPDYGPFNHHFIRDIGCAFLAFGMAMIWAAFRAALRFPFLLVTTLFYGGHAVVHVYETASGAVNARHWLIDLPGVYAPAALLLTMTLIARRMAQRSREPSDAAAQDAAIRDLEG